MNENSKFSPKSAARMTPSNVLSKYKQYLSNDGSIRACEEAVWFSNMMPKITHVIERCMLLNIIDATVTHASPPIIEKFLNNGGWSTIDVWYQYYLKENNTSLLLHITKILEKLPITIQRLRNVTIAKSVKAASKMPDPELKQSSKFLIKRWKALVLETKTNQGKKSSESTISSVSMKRTKSPEPGDDKTKMVKEETNTNNFIRTLDTATEISKQETSSEFYNSSLITEPIDDDSIQHDVQPSSIGYDDEDASFHSEIMEEEYNNLEQPDWNTDQNIVEADTSKSKSTKRKSVSWKPDSDLVSVRYFERDISPTQSSKNNAYSENNANGTESAMGVWKTLISIDHESDSLVKSFGGSSNEKILQSKHEEQFIKMMKHGVDVVENKSSPKEPEGADRGAGVKPRIFPKNINNAPVISRPARAPATDPNVHFMHPSVPCQNYPNPNVYGGDFDGRTNHPPYRYPTGGRGIPRVGCRPNRLEPVVGHRAPYPRPQYPIENGHVFNRFPMDERHATNFRPPYNNGRPPLRYANNQQLHSRPPSNIHSNENYNRGGLNQHHHDGSFHKQHNIPPTFPPTNYPSQNSIPPQQPPSNFKPNYPKTIKCRVHSAGGVCRFGDKCRYIHDDS